MAWTEGEQLIWRPAQQPSYAELTVTRKSSVGLSNFDYAALHTMSST